jgi:CMP/dCMP kinase
MIIAIDGPSGSGKSTIARGIAKGFTAKFISSGSIYRAICYFTLKEKIELDAIKQLSISDLTRLEMKLEEGGPHFSIDNQSISEKLVNQEVANQASKIAKFKNIRQIVNDIVHNLAKDNDCVIEGRDIGTYVFPDAFIKIYLTANIETRAKRRLKEYDQHEEGSSIALASLMDEMQERDRQDIERQNNPLKKAQDAFDIDTSNLTVPEVMAKIIKYYRSKVRVATKGVCNHLKVSGVGFAYRCFQGFCHKWFRLMYRLEVHGLEHFMHCSRGAILAANHTSFFDPPMIGSASPGEIFFLAQDYLFRVPLLGSLIKKLNSYPVKGGSQGDFFVLKQIISLLKEGKKVVVFPEGSRSENGCLKDFKQGVALLCMQSGASILPIYIDGAYQVFPKGRLFFKPFGQFKLFFGREISCEKFNRIEKKEARKLIMNQLSDEIIKLKERSNFIYC